MSIGRQPQIGPFPKGDDHLRQAHPVDQNLTSRDRSPDHVWVDSHFYGLTEHRGGSTDLDVGDDLDAGDFELDG